MYGFHSMLCTFKRNQTNKLCQVLNSSLNDNSLVKMPSRSSSLFDSYSKGEICPSCMQFNRQTLSLAPKICIKPNPWVSEFSKTSRFPLLMKKSIWQNVITMLYGAALRTATIKVFSWSVNLIHFTVLFILSLISSSPVLEQSKHRTLRMENLLLFLLWKRSKQTNSHFKC